MMRTAFVTLAMLAAAAGAAAQTAAPARTVNTIQQSARQAVAGAPNILIPPSSVGLDLCLGEGSGAYGNARLAVTLSGPMRDRDCTAIRLSKWAADLPPGHLALAYQIACDSRPWREADAVTERLCVPLRRAWWRFW